MRSSSRRSSCSGPRSQPRADPLPEPVGVQVGGLLEAHQVREEVRRRDHVPDSRAGQEGLREAALVHPRCPLEAGAERHAVDGLVGEVAVGLVFEQRQAELIKCARDLRARGGGVAGPARVLEGRHQVGERRPLGARRRQQSLGVDPRGGERQTHALGAEQAERLERREVGGSLHEDSRSGIDEQLGGQVDALLRAREHEDLRGSAAQSEGSRLHRDRLAQLGLALGHAVLPGGAGHRLPIWTRQCFCRRQAAGERDHARMLRSRQDVADQGGGEPVDALREHPRLASRPLASGT